MTHDEALESVMASVDNRNLVRHMMGTEAVMRALARHLDKNLEEWGLTGLLHDIDAELTEGDMAIHSRLGADLARELGTTEAMARAIFCHNEVHGVAARTELDKALICADPLTGLITASALVRPDKKLVGLEAASIAKRLNEKGFAAAVSRAQISRCSELGLELGEFIRLGLQAMKNVAPSIGL